MDNRPKHTGLTLIGIYLSNFLNIVITLGGIILILLSLIYLFFWGLDSYVYYGVYLPLGILSITLGFYNMSILRKFYAFEKSDYIFVGLMTLIPSLIIGGIFILIDGNRSIQNALVNSSKIQNNSTLEYKLKEIENLFERRIITKDEYDLKRKDIISRY